MSIPTLDRTTAHTPATKSRFRADIQGLRAFAVVLVVLDHVFAWPSGGYLGVDVFYVISGFLITSLLLRENSVTGGFSFRAFYARRVKRILPAAIVVLVVTVVAGYLLWYEPRANQTLLDAFAAMVFVENWHLIGQGADYLRAVGPASPVQHYWSLSVEEQFYAVWPVVLFVLLKLARPQHRRRGLAIVIGLGIVVSLAYSAYRTGSSPSQAYFDTIARAWELLAGALIAVVGEARSSHRIRQIVSVAGTATIVASAFIIQVDSPFPWPWALLPVAGAAAVIWSAAGEKSNMLLANRPAQYLGKISYSLYLWHFPVIIFVQSITNSWLAAVCTLPIMLVVSALSYRWIEQPILRGGWLKAWSTSKYRQRNWRDVVPVVAVVIFLVAMTGLQYRGPAYVQDGTAFAVALGEQRTSAVEPLNSNPSGTELRALIQRAVQHPNLTPAVRAALNANDTSQQAPAMLETSPGCRNTVGQTEPLLCSYGSVNAAHTVLVVGDSVALSWLPAIEAIYLPAGWRVEGIGFASCSVMTVNSMPRVRSSTFVKACAASRDMMIRTAVKLHPDVVIASGDEGAYDRLADGATGARAASEWVAGIRTTIRRLSAATDNVVVLSNPPVAADPRTCATRVSTLANCTLAIDTDYRLMSAAERSAVSRQIAAGPADVRYVDAAPLFCWQNECPATIGDVVVRTDIAHVSNAASNLVARALSRQLPSPN